MKMTYIFWNVRGLNLGQKMVIELINKYRSLVIELVKMKIKRDYWS